MSVFSQHYMVFSPGQMLAQHKTIGGLRSPGGERVRRNLSHGADVDQVRFNPEPAKTVDKDEHR